jgi:hypothetical protein
MPEQSSPQPRRAAVARMPFCRRAVATLPLVILLSLVGPAPADAAATTVRDAARDAPAPIDIMRFRANNAEDQIFMKLRVRDLRRVGRFSLSYYQFNLPGSESGFEGGSVAVRRVPGEGLRIRYEWMGGDEVTEKRPCPGLQVRWGPKRDRILLVVPQACFTGQPVPDKWRFFAFASLSGDFDATREFVVRRG